MYMCDLTDVQNTIILPVLFLQDVYVWPHRRSEYYHTYLCCFCRMYMCDLTDVQNTIIHTCAVSAGCICVTSQTFRILSYIPVLFLQDVHVWPHRRSEYYHTYLCCFCRMYMCDLTDVQNTIIHTCAVSAGCICVTSQTFRILSYIPVLFLQDVYVWPHRRSEYYHTYLCCFCRMYMCDLTDVQNTIIHTCAVSAGCICVTSQTFRILSYIPVLFLQDVYVWPHRRSEYYHTTCAVSAGCICVTSQTFRILSHIPVLFLQDVYVWPHRRSEYYHTYLCCFCRMYMCDLTDVQNTIIHTCAVSAGCICVTSQTFRILSYIPVLFLQDVYVWPHRRSEYYHTTCAVSAGCICVTSQTFRILSYYLCCFCRMYMCDLTDVQNTIIHTCAVSAGCICVTSQTFRILSYIPVLFLQDVYVWPHRRSEYYHTYLCCFCRMYMCDLTDVQNTIMHTCAVSAGCICVTSQTFRILSYIPVLFLQDVYVWPHRRSEYYHTYLCCFCRMYMCDLTDVQNTIIHTCAVSAGCICVTSQTFRILSYIPVLFLQDVYVWPHRRSEYYHTYLCCFCRMYMCDLTDVQNTIIHTCAVSAGCICVTSQTFRILSYIPVLFLQDVYVWPHRRSEYYHTTCAVSAGCICVTSQTFRILSYIPVLFLQDVYVWPHRRSEYYHAYLCCFCRMYMCDLTDVQNTIIHTCAVSAGCICVTSQTFRILSYIPVLFLQDVYVWPHRRSEYYHTYLCCFCRMYMCDLTDVQNTIIHTCAVSAGCICVTSQTFRILSYYLCCFCRMYMCDLTDVQNTIIHTCAVSAGCTCVTSQTFRILSYIPVLFLQDVHVWPHRRSEYYHTYLCCFCRMYMCDLTDVQNTIIHTCAVSAGCICVTSQTFRILSYIPVLFLQDVYVWPHRRSEYYHTTCAVSAGCICVTSQTFRILSYYLCCFCRMYMCDLTDVQNTIIHTCAVSAGCICVTSQTFRILSYIPVLFLQDVYVWPHRRSEYYHTYLCCFCRMYMCDLTDVQNTIIHTCAVSAGCTCVTSQTFRILSYIPVLFLQDVYVWPHRRSEYYHTYLCCFCRMNMCDLTDVQNTIIHTCAVSAGCICVTSQTFRILSYIPVLFLQDVYVWPHRRSEYYHTYLCCFCRMYMCDLTDVQNTIIHTCAVSAGCICVTSQTFRILSYIPVLFLQDVHVWPHRRSEYYHTYLCCFCRMYMCDLTDVQNTIIHTCAVSAGCICVTSQTFRILSYIPVLFLQDVYVWPHRRSEYYHTTCAVSAGCICVTSQTFRILSYIPVLFLQDVYVWPHRRSEYYHTYLCCFCRMYMCDLTDVQNTIILPVLFLQDVYVWPHRRSEYYHTTCAVSAGCICVTSQTFRILSYIPVLFLQDVYVWPHRRSEYYHTYLCCFCRMYMCDLTDVQNTIIHTCAVSAGCICVTSQTFRILSYIPVLFLQDVYVWPHRRSEYYHTYLCCFCRMYMCDLTDVQNTIIHTCAVSAGCICVGGIYCMHRKYRFNCWFTVWPDCQALQHFLYKIGLKKYKYIFWRC